MKFKILFILSGQTHTFYIKKQQNNYLFGENFSLADIAIFPFVRQFAAVDNAWFASAAYPKLRAWLNEWVNSDLFKSVMTKNPTFID